MSNLQFPYAILPVDVDWHSPKTKNKLKNITLWFELKGLIIYDTIQG